MNHWMIIIIAGSICIAMRTLPALILRRVKIPAALYLFMHYIPITIFSAMIALEVFFWNNHLSFDPLYNVKLIAAFVSALIALKTKNIILTVIVGVFVMLLCYVAL